MLKQSTTSKQLTKEFLEEQQNPKDSKKDLLDDKNIQDYIGKLNRIYIRSLNKASDIPYFIDYLKLLISLINKSKDVNELYVYGIITNKNSNYCACRIDVTRNPLVECKTYNNMQHITMNFDELLGNCSTVSFHHFQNVTGGFYPGLFDDPKKTELFVHGVKHYMREVLNYSNIFYSISRESDIGLTEYCSNNCKQIFEFKNRRTDHNIKYYCENL